MGYEYGDVVCPKAHPQFSGKVTGVKGDNILVTFMDGKTKTYGRNDIKPSMGWTKGCILKVNGGYRIMMDGGAQFNGRGGRPFPTVEEALEYGDRLGWSIRNEVKTVPFKASPNNRKSRDKVVANAQAYGAGKACNSYGDIAVKTESAFRRMSRIAYWLTEWVRHNKVTGTDVTKEMADERKRFADELAKISQFADKADSDSFQKIWKSAKSNFDTVARMFPKAGDANKAKMDCDKLSDEAWDVKNSGVSRDTVVANAQAYSARMTAPSSVMNATDPSTHEYKSKRALIDGIYRQVKSEISGFKRDQAWENVMAVFRKIQQMSGAKVSWGVKNGGYRTYPSGSQGKEYQVTVEKDGFVVNGTLTAHAAGTVDDPFSRYDITLVLW